MSKDQGSCWPRDEFYKETPIKVSDIPSRADEFYLHANSLGEFRCFLVAFRKLYGSQFIKGKLGQWSDEQLQEQYSRIRTSSFWVLKFDGIAGNNGCEQLGFGLYPNFTRFEHCCTPDLYLLFTRSLCGPVIRGGRGLNPVSKPFNRLTITRAEVPFQAFGTNVLLRSELDSFLLLNHAITQCDCASCSQDPRDQELVQRYGITQRCRKCGDNHFVVAGVCDCQLQSTAGYISSLRLKESQSSCKVCQGCRIPLSKRARCLRSSCRNRFFKISPAGEYRKDGPPAFIQALEQISEREDEYSFPSRRPPSNLMSQANMETNVLAIREVERYYWQLARDVSGGAFAGGVADVWKSAMTEVLSAEVLFKFYHAHLPFLSFANIAMSWLIFDVRREVDMLPLRIKSPRMRKFSDEVVVHSYSLHGMAMLRFGPESIEAEISEGFYEGRCGARGLLEVIAKFRDEPIRFDVFYQ